MQLIVGAHLKQWAQCVPHTLPSTSMLPKGLSVAAFNCQDLHFTIHTAQRSPLLHQRTAALRSPESGAQVTPYPRRQLWHLAANTALDQVRESAGPEG